METVVESLPLPPPCSLDLPLDSNTATDRTNGSTDSNSVSSSSSKSSMIQENTTIDTTISITKIMSLEPLIITPLAPVELDSSFLIKKEQVKQATQAPSSPASSPRAIAYPSTPVDRYGFLITDKRFTRTKGENDPVLHRSQIWLENRRTQKWLKMIGKELEDWEVCQLRSASKLKKRIRKGIPDALRGRTWCHLAGSTQMLLNNPGVYRELVQKREFPCEESISRDIGRTFPKHYLFNEHNPLGQGALMNVLKAYSIHDPEVGYCQGMGFLSAMFLSYIPEEQSFWHLVACLNHKRYDLANLYRPGMPKVTEVMGIFEILFRDMLPELAKHLDKEGLHPTMYLSQWFITVFTYSFPFEFVTRVWDVFLYEGWKVVYRIALALLKISQKRLMSLRFEGIMEYFKELPTSVDVDQVFQVAFKLPLKNVHIEAAKENYPRLTSTRK